MFESAQDRLGQQVGNYRLTGWLGQGGFADVYQGEHIYLKTQCALKMLHVQLSEAAFLTEAQTIARLEHPHIVRVFDYGVDHGNPYLVMSYAPNGSLRKRFPRGTRVEPAQVVTMTQQMAAALDYAHRQKLIHRDVKPENMLVGQHDQVLLSDFGLALVAQSASSQTACGLAGTIPYMAPEQLQGRVCFASDQYALGIAVYEWLCGDRPFTGAFSEIAGQQVLAAPPSLWRRVPGLSPVVEQVVFKALAKDPAGRYEDVTTFATALGEACRQPPSLSSTTFVLVPAEQAPLPPGAVPLSGPHGAQLAMATSEQAPNQFSQGRSGLLDQSTAVPAPGASSPSLPGSVQPATTILLPPVPAPAQPSRRRDVPWRAALLLVSLLVVIAGGLGAWYGLAHLSGRDDHKQSVPPGTVQQNPSTAVTGNAPATAGAKTTATVGQETPISTPGTPWAQTSTPTTGPTLTPTPTAVPDCLKGSPSALTFSSLSLKPQVVTLTNCGGGTPGWSSLVQTETGGNWLSVSPSSGKVDPHRDENVSVSVSHLSLPLGTYHGTLTFTQGSATWVLTVEYTII
jgi:serine/threonine protein kinase